MYGSGPLNIKTKSGTAYRRYRVSKVNLCSPLTYTLCLMVGSCMNDVDSSESGPALLEVMSKIGSVVEGGMEMISKKWGCYVYGTK